MLLLSRKPASLEAWLEVFRMERPKGVEWVPPPDPVWALFRDHFRDPFRNTFSWNSDPKTAPKIGPKMVPKSVFFWVRV